MTVEHVFAVLGTVPAEYFKRGNTWHVRFTYNGCQSAIVFVEADAATGLVEAVDVAQLL